MVKHFVIFVLACTLSLFTSQLNGQHTHDAALGDLDPHDYPKCTIFEPDSTVQVEIIYAGDPRPRLVTAQAKDGKAFIEGGILVGDIDYLQSRDINDRSIVCDVCNKWENDVIPYTIDPGAGYSQSQINIIESAIETLNNSTNLCIVPRTDEYNYVEIINDTGCYSYVGQVNLSTQSGMQPLSLKRPTANSGGSCLFSGTIIHEFLHASGIYHEQSRLDRDDFVLVDTSNVQDGAEGNFGKVSSNIGADISDYDYRSIMHYGAFDFTKNGQPTITKLDGSTSGIGGNVLRPSDIAGVNYLYSGDYVHPAEQDLISVYNNTSGDQWNENDGWNDGSCTPCGWTGVTCNGFRVGALDLSDNGLTGTFSDISDLEMLSNLDLSNNNLTGGLPAINSTTFPELITLDLSGNDFNFDAFEGNFDGIQEVTIGTQDNFELIQNGLVLTATNAGGTPAFNTYTWFKNGAQVAQNVGNPNYTIGSDFKEDDGAIQTRAEDTYTATVTNSQVSDVTINSNPVTAEAALPVTLIDFEGREELDYILLEWSTASEVNNEGFEIQRSKDGRAFENIGYVKGNGTTNRTISYEYEDGAPLSGRNYYRLNQVDFNGNSEQSKVISVNSSANGGISIFPTITRGNKFIVKNAKGLNVEFYNFAGAAIAQKTISSNKETIEIENINRGIYIVMIDGKSHKIVIQ